MEKILGIYQMVMIGDWDELALQVTYDKNREKENRRARSDPNYVPNEEDLVVDEELVAELKGITDPVERQRMLKAIIKEIVDLIAIGTFELEPLPVGRQAVKSKLVLKVKYFADGKYNKHKARLVAKGFMQKLGLDFFSAAYSSSRCALFQGA